MSCLKKIGSRSQIKNGHCLELTKAQAERKLPISLERLERVVAGNNKLERQLADFLLWSLRYTETVTEYLQATRLGATAEATVKVTEASGHRRNIHDQMIQELEHFVSTLESFGKPVDWSDSLIGERAACGRFAICLTIVRCDD